MRKLGESVLATRNGEPVPDDGYHGEYVADLAAAVPADVAAAAAAPGADGADVLGRWASERVRAGIEASLERLGVHFDVWKSEGSLHSEGWVDRAIERLRAGGHLYEQDGALWFRSTTFGDDKDRVLIRSTGEPTYFAADVGYVVEKLSRGFDHLIYIWGVDHHGYIARTRGAAEAMGFDPARVEVLLTGWVSILRGGQVVAMSKRAGDIYLLDTLLDEIGNDAARWFFASRGTQLDIEVDVELARRQSSENPVYYVQYAHARIASILRKAADAGLSPAPDVAGLLSGEPEALLVRAIARLPRGRRGRGRGPGDPGDHRLRDRARDPVPRLLSRRARRGRGAAGAFDEAARAGARGDDDARERARAARDLGPRVDVAAGGRPQAGSAGEAEDVREPAHGVVRARGHEDHAIGLGRQDRGAPAERLQLRHDAREGRRVLARVGVGVPAGVEDHARRAVRAVDERDPVAAPAGRRGLGRRAVHAGRVAEHDPQLELAQRVLERHAPAVAEPLREVVGERHRHRRLARVELLGVEDLLGRVGRVGEQGVDARVAAARREGAERQR